MTHYITLTENDQAIGFTEEDVELLESIYTTVGLTVTREFYTHSVTWKKTIDYSVWDTQIALAKKRHREVMRHAPSIIAARITCSFEVHTAYARLFSMNDKIRSDILAEIDETHGSLASLAALTLNA